jgi:glycosyltransferase involved in cell wall biosynthesis
MKYFYICSMTGESGISKYASSFYENILKPRGYVHVDSNENLSAIFTKIASKDQVHIEIGIFQKKEQQILFLMLAAGYKHVSVTMHDAPILKYPLKEFTNPFLNNLSKFYDRFISRFRNTTQWVGKIKAVYILTKKGVDKSSRLYKTNNFHFLPHIVDFRPDRFSPQSNKNFIYLGFIGRNKGIEYALKLHREIIKQYPDVQFYIIGRAMGRQKPFYEWLRKTYTSNVHFLGYVEEGEMKEIFDKTQYALIPFRKYNYFFPASGSILTSMSMGKIVLSNRVNAISEIIKDKENGILLTGGFREDILRITSLYNDIQLQKKIVSRSRQHLQKLYGADRVAGCFFKPEKEKEISVDNFQ